MHKVESKYKNPDKYIRGLKQRIRDMNNSRLHLLTDRGNTIHSLMGQVNAAKGEVICTWKPTRKTQGMSSGFNLGKLKPKQRIAMIGVVKKVSMSTCASGNEESEIEYELIETRRLPE